MAGQLPPASSPPPPASSPPPPASSPPETGRRRRAHAPAQSEPERRDTGWLTTGRRAAPEPEDDPPSDDQSDDQYPEASRAMVAAWTIGVFALPTLIYLVWAFTRSATPPPYCVGAAECPAPRTEALTAFLDALPALVGAVVLAVAVAVLRASTRVAVSTMVRRGDRRRNHLS